MHKVPGSTIYVLIWQDNINFLNKYNNSNFGACCNKNCKPLFNDNTNKNYMQYSTEKQADNILTQRIHLLMQHQSASTSKFILALCNLTD